MEYPRLETLSLVRNGPVGWLINNRPDQLNAMNALMRDEFELAWRALDADPEVRVIVHTGIVHQDLDRPVCEQSRQRRLGCRGIDDIELNRFRGAAKLPEFRCERSAGVDPQMRMNDDMNAGSGEATRDRLSERAATAGDECPPHATLRSSTTAARPSSRMRFSLRRAKL